MKPIVLLILLLPVIIKAQDLKKHQWQHRIIVVYSSEFDSEPAQKQLQLLEAEMIGLQERKLKIYHVTNSGYTEDFGKEMKVSKRPNKSIKSFSATLIGLDGTEKENFSSPQEASVFFELIDQMPMRRSEIRNEE